MGSERGPKSNFGRLTRIANFKTHKSALKRHDHNDFLKFVCQPESKKSIHLPRLSSLDLWDYGGSTHKDMTGKHRVPMRSAKKNTSAN